MSRLLLALVLLQAALQTQNGSVAGQVLRQDGQPAAGLRIAAMTIPDAASPKASSSLVSLTETESDGRYRLENIPPGRYYVMAGLVAFPTYYPGTIDLGAARVVEVTSTRAVTGVDFNLLRAVSVTVSGRLVGLQGPLPVTITAISPGAPPLQSMALVDGSFEFLRVPPGTYTLRAPGAGSELITLANTDVNVDLKPSSESPGVPVTGRVLGSSSLPADSLTVVLREMTAPSYPMTTMTRTDGTFEFPRVPPGIYNATLPPSLMGGPGSTIVEVRDKAVQGVSIQIPFVVEITGRLVNENGTPNASRGSVEFRRINGLSGTAITNGIFTAYLREGEHQLAVGQLPPGYSVKSINYGGIDITKGSLKIDAATPPKEIIVTLNFVPFSGKGVTVSGRLTVQSPGLRLELIGQGSTPSPNPVTVSDDGTFQLSNVLPGGYLVRLSGATLDSQSENLLVRETDIRGLVLGARPEAIVEGRIFVFDEKGSPVPIPQWLLIKFQQPRGTTQTPVQGDSTFRLSLTEGEHAVSVSSLPAGYSIKSIISGTIDLKSQMLKIVGTNRPADVQITLEYKP